MLRWLKKDGKMILQEWEETFIQLDKWRDVPTVDFYPNPPLSAPVATETYTKIKQSAREEFCDNFSELAKQHYWDSLQLDKNIILKHIEWLLQCVRNKKLPRTQEL